MNNCITLLSAFTPFCGQLAACAVFPLYLNSKVRTLDTFSFYANPKAWIAQNEASNTYKAKFNILMFPEFIGALTITTYHSAAKTIEVNMEQLSNRLKAIAESHIYKKA